MFIKGGDNLQASDLPISVVPNSIDELSGEVAGHTSHTVVLPISVVPNSIDELSGEVAGHTSHTVVSSQQYLHSEEWAVTNSMISFVVLK